MSSIFGGGKKQEAPKPQPLPQAPTVDDASKAANENVRKKRAAVTEGSKTIYTNPLGIGGQASVIKKTLLGQ